MKFSHVAECFDRIESLSSRLEITHLLATLLKEATPHEASLIAYLSLGELSAPYHGAHFNVATKTLIKVIAQVFEKAPSTIQEAMKKMGDIGLVAFHYGEKKSASSDLSLLEVNHKLNEIHSISGEKSQELKEKKIGKLFEELDASSIKYVARIIVGKLRLGFSDMTLIDAFSWMEKGNKSIRSTLEDAYNICADIGLIIQTLKENGISAVEKMHINVGIPLRPAAAERLESAKAIVHKLGPCLAEPKIDGFRLQVHIKKSAHTTSIHFFSRNLLDMSPMFPELRLAASKLDVSSLVAEGEAIGFNEETGSFLPFQETVTRKRKHGIESAAEENPLQLHLFDLMYLNGESYLTKPLSQRRKALLKVCDQEPVKYRQTLHAIKEIHIENAAQLEAYFNEQISAGLEGVMVKKADSIYQAGKRNFNWIKLKREESGELEDTIDCVILGYYSGAGKRAHFGIGAFLVGIYNKKNDCFETIAKIGTGLSDEEWKALKKQCDERTVAHKPHNVECAKELACDVWVLPEIVCSIRADEITLSPLHTAGKTKEHSGYALRFPRIIVYRSDKSAFDATTLSEVEHLYTLQFKKD